MVKNQNSESTQQQSQNNKQFFRSLKRCLHCHRLGMQNQIFDSKQFSKHMQRKHKNQINSYQANSSLRLIEDYDFEYQSKIIRKQKNAIQQIKNQQKLQLTFNQNQSQTTQNQLNLIPITEQKDQQKNQQYEAQNELLKPNMKEIPQIQLYQQSQQDNYKFLSEQLEYQKEMINHLASFSQLIQKNETAKNIIIKYANICGMTHEEINNIKKQTKAETKKIEFTSDAIENYLNIIQENQQYDQITQQLLKHEFIAIAQQHLLKIINKFLNFFENKIETEQSNFQQSILNHPNIDIDEIQQQYKIDIQKTEQIFQTYKEATIKFQKNLNQNFQQQIKFPSISINADVYQENVLRRIGEIQKKFKGKKFDVLEVDYPWPLNFLSKNGKRFLNYKTQSISRLFQLQIEELQDQGYLFMWTISSRFLEAMAFMVKKGYRFVDSLVWVKKGKFTQVKSGQGYHFRHSKEICIVGLKGNIPQGTRAYQVGDVIASVPGKNSEKPVLIKYLIEFMVPNGFFCEVFARKNNLRDGWVSIGNEL